MWDGLVAEKSVPPVRPMLVLEPVLNDAVVNLSVLKCSLVRETGPAGVEKGMAVPKPANFAFNSLIRLILTSIPAHLGVVRGVLAGPAALFSSFLGAISVLEQSAKRPNLPATRFRANQSRSGASRYKN